MIFTDENGKKYEAVTHPDFGVGYLIKPIKEAEKPAWNVNAWPGFNNNDVVIQTSLSPAQAEAVAASIKALLAYIHTGEVLVKADYITAANAARKAVQEEV